VKMVLSRAESLRAHPKRHAFKMHYRTGARHDGTLTAMEVKIIGDAGAYASESTPVIRTAIGTAGGCYYVPNLALDGYAVYTNNPTAGAMRGFGIPQVIFALEQQMDRLARELGISPLTLRRRNALVQGKMTSTGQVLREPTALPEVIRVAERAVRNLDHLPPPPPGKRRGIGVAAGIKPTGLGFGRDPGAGAAVEITSQGEILVRVGGVELGQGLETMAAQVAAQTLGVSYDQVRVIVGDTQETPNSGPTIASRQTYVTGSAIMKACRELRERLLDYVAEAFEIPRAFVLLKGGVFLSLESEEGLCSVSDFPALAQKRDWQLWEEAHYLPPKTYALGEAPDDESGDSSTQGDTHFGLAFSVHAAAVDVDETTGDVDVIKLILVHDVGRALHPQNVEAQLEGGAIMGMGYALSEAYHAYGRNASVTLRDCHVPDICCAPVVEVLLVEQDSMVGLSGGKAVGETGAIPTAPAIINAIYDATGVRIADLPATRGKIRDALMGGYS
jgi:xanthine dehydrogenase molybdenum-binding subunit